MHTYICYLVRQVSLWQPKGWCGPASNSMVNNFIHHSPNARAHVPYSVLEFKRRSNYQQRNKWNFALPWFICSSQVTSIKYRTIVNPSDVFSRFPNKFIIHGKFRQIPFLSEPARTAGWQKHSEIAFLSDRLVSVLKSVSKVYTLKCNYEQNILPCKLLLWFPTQLNIG